jgi:hypothetical protein
MSDQRQIAIDVDVHRAIEKARRSFGENENDILRRLLLRAPTAGRSTANSLIGKNSRRRSPLSGSVSRSRGLWSVRVKGKRISATNMKDAYRLLLLELADLDPGFLDRFAAEGSSRRRFVAASPEGLYASSPHLAGDHARHLVDDWYFDTNLSAEQVARRVRVAARVAGLAYGRDVQLLDNLREL